jgi:predicted GNAT family acetyltransferase
VSWRLTSDVAEYVALAGEFVAARPAENTVLLTVAETVRKRGPGAFGDTAPLFGWWEAGGAFVHTPPHPLAPTDLPEPAVQELAAELAGRALSGVVGPADVARAFAAASGRRATERRREWLYRLGQLTPPQPPPGRVVPAADVDRELLVAWMAAFLDYIGDAPDAAPRHVENRLEGMSVWVRDGEPVSLVAASPPLAGMVRIGPVYTPAEQRGHGYAAALTAAACRRALDDGVEHVLLFADVANETSNRLYRRLGFEALQERLFVAF